jgi:phospholipid-translocating ATPase
LEIVKLAQMFLLNDIDMYDEVSDTPFEARTSTINEELGQIRYDAFRFSVIHDS